MDDAEPAAHRAERRQRVVKAVRLPILSGKASVLAMIGCFLVPALLIPLVFRQPLWIDFEIVVACWWLIWVIALTLILYHGHKVSDDHAMKEPRSWGLKNWVSGWNLGDIGLFDFSPSVDGEACAIGCLILAALPLLVLLIWVLWEVAIPLLAFVAYVLVRAQLAHVANDKHGCEGSLIKAPLWGILWATIYTAPLAGLIWFVHFMATKRG
jgi:hypothetical protein